MTCATPTAVTEKKRRQLRNSCLLVACDSGCVVYGACVGRTAMLVSGIRHLMVRQLYDYKVKRTICKRENDVVALRKTALSKYAYFKTTYKCSQLKHT